MRRFSLSNLQLRSNLLSLEYQHEIRRVTVFEFKNIRERNPNLMSPENLTEAQRQEWRERLFWGDRSVSMSDDDRARAWPELLAEGIPEALVALETRPDLERAFEILIVTELLSSPQMQSHYRTQALAWGERVRAVLARDEFRLPRDLVDQRLAGLLGVAVTSRPAERERTVVAK
jgi:hypothetical protein